MNPTSGALEGKIAALEGGPAALAVASGHAAQFLTFHTLMEPGCEIVAARKLYGGSQNQLGQSFRKMAWHTQFVDARSEEHTSELQSLMRISYAVFCLKKKTKKQTKHMNNYNR